MGCVLKYKAFKVTVNGDAVFFALYGSGNKIFGKCALYVRPCSTLKKLLNLQAMEDGRDEHVLR